MNTPCAQYTINGQYTDADTNNNGQIEVSEAQAVTKLDVYSQNIVDMTGILSFSNLQRLDCFNNELTNLNVQGLTNLLSLSCSHNELVSLNLQGLSNLQILICSYNKLTSLNLQGLTDLVELKCNSNLLTSLNVQGSAVFYNIECTNNQLTSLILPATSSSYATLKCSNNRLTLLNTQGLANVQELWCDNNLFTTLNLQGMTSLVYLYCRNNTQLTSLNLNGLTALEHLRCEGSRLTSLTLQGLTRLRFVFCDNNQITNLIIENLPNLTNLYCNDNQILSLNLQGATNLIALICSYNPIVCLPLLPQTLTTLNTSNTNVTCLPNIPPNLQTTLPLCGFNNTNGCLSANARIYGKTYQDLNNNCLPDATDILQQNILVQARNTATQAIYTTNSNASGFYEMGLPTPATYEVKTIILNNNYWQSCAPQTIFLAADTVQAQRDMLIKPVVQCADIEVNHQLQNIARPCSTAVYKVSVFNAGTIVAAGLSAKITLPTELTMQTATYPFTDLGGDVYLFSLPNVGALERDTFSFSAAVSCSAVMNQMLCTNVAITPNTYCTGGGLQGWDGSDVQVSGRCIGSDSIRFVIRNVGQGGMSTGRNYGVIEDMVMIRSSTFQLPAGTSDSITVAANALRVYRIVADEAPNNPAGNTQEQFMVWGCHGQNSAIHWGFVNNFSLNNGTSNPHQLCEAVRTSFDPNDISAKAEGVGAQHFILKKSDIEYKIRFQNTGNDTAFVVRVLDKLPNELDASTLRIGTASHPFTWRLASNGTLEFLFQNILLPDSTTNEVRSHGFVTYRIATKNNLTDGTTINNQAQIYFDVNAPVATNIYTHTIGENLSTILFTTPQIVDNQYNIKVFPNPMRTEATLQIFPKSGVLENENLNFTLYNTLGQTVKTQTFAGQKLTLTRDGLPQGIYFYGITQDGRVIARGKVEVQ